MNDTPRTDAQINGEPCTRFGVLAGNSLRDALVPSEFARQLERDLAALLKDNEEQARLLGMSAERECDLRGKVRKLERENAALREKVDDWENAALHALDHRPDEQHCTCVAPLIGKVKQLQRELATAQGEVKRLTKQIKDDNRSYGCELRDPNGTIWEQATKDHDRAEKAERELAALRESYAYAEISLPAELIPARMKEPK